MKVIYTLKGQDVHGLSCHEYKLGLRCVQSLEDKNPDVLFPILKLKLLIFINNLSAHDSSGQLSVPLYHGERCLEHPNSCQDYQLKCQWNIKYGT